MQKVFDLFDRQPLIPAALFLFVFALIFLNFRKKRGEARAIEHVRSFGKGNAPVSAPAPVRQQGALSDALFYWDGRRRDPFTMRDLVRSVAIFGATGSGKTTGPGLAIAKALVSAKGKRRQVGGQLVGGPIGGLILASKPEDRQFWQKIFHQAGRINDLVIFDPKSPYRFNFIDYIQRCGGDTRDITEAIMVIGETLEQGDNPNRDKFWNEQNRRMIHTAVEIIRLAKGTVTAPDIQRFIMGAALTPASLATPEWQSGFHNKCLKAAFNNVRTSVQKHDYILAADNWLKEYPSMADKTRSSIQVGVLGILHVFNTGIVRELVSTSTNITPVVMDSGLWVLVDMPISSYGAAGAFILAGWKYLTQRHMLHRKATDDTAICVLWADEAQKVVNSFDASFLAECRSHRACMVYLTQSIHAYYTRLKEGGEHEADGFCTNFYTKIFTAVGDDKTAAYASSLIGKRLKAHVNTSMSPAKDAYEGLFGEQQFSSSTSQSIENVLENREFMQNLRTGGEENGCIVDAIVVRSGQPFSNGENYLKVAFSQK
jgi:hypothetical protein